jgi:hypothetical protein
MGPDKDFSKLVEYERRLEEFPFHTAIFIQLCLNLTPDGS